MKTEIEWAELHAPLFLAGTNLGQKLDPKKRSGLKMMYDEDKRHLYVIYNAQMARVPETSVLSMVESKTVQTLKEKIAEGEAALAHVPIHFRADAAQVSTPMSHVFAGPGGGQTEQDPTKRGPGRPPKGAA